MRPDRRLGVGLIHFAKGGVLRANDRAAAASWMDLAAERGADVTALTAANRKLAAVYFQGYVAEAYAKALCRANGKKPEKTHNLMSLIETADFKRQDLPPDLREYAETRSVELRYLIQAQATTDFDVELDRGKRLAAWLKIRLNRLL
jgi:HEPN domain-containing protein